MGQNIIFEYRKNILKVNQKEFAKILKDKFPGIEIDKNKVSHWEEGKYFPDLPIREFLAGQMGKTERDVINNLTRHLKPSEYTLNGKLKTDIQRNTY